MTLENKNDAGSGIGEQFIGDDFIEQGSFNPENEGGEGSGEKPTENNQEKPKSDEKPKEDDILSILDDDEGDAGAEGDDDSSSDDGEENENDAEKQQQQQKPKENRSQKRIRELAAAKNQRDVQLAEALARIQVLETQLTTPAQQSNEIVAPDPNNFEYGLFDPNYQTELASYNFAKLQAEHEKNAVTAAERERQQEIQKAEIIQREIIKNRVTEVMAEGEALYEDFKDSVMSDKYSFTETMGETMLNCENAAEIAYRISKNPTHAAKLAALPPAAQMREIFRLDFELSNRKATARASKAPPPPSSTKTGGSAGKSASIRPDTDNLDDFEKILYK